MRGCRLIIAWFPYVFPFGRCFMTHQPMRLNVCSHASPTKPTQYTTTAHCRHEPGKSARLLACSHRPSSQAVRLLFGRRRPCVHSAKTWGAVTVRTNKFSKFFCFRSSADDDVATVLVQPCLGRSSARSGCTRHAAKRRRTVVQLRRQPVRPRPASGGSKRSNVPPSCALWRLSMCRRIRRTTPQARAAARTDSSSPKGRSPARTSWTSSGRGSACARPARRCGALPRAAGR